MICPKCNAEIDNRFKTCPECGAAFELPPGTIFGDIRLRRKKKGKEKTPEEE
ncbi:MAG: zinc ribbon domain-containing protein, partial [Lentisphaeria bacterium]|nr:zinc ribbon domain-containing protein [Lentisphaeria bacterium]